MLWLKRSTWAAFDVGRDYADDPWDHRSHATNLFALIERMQSFHLTTKNTVLCHSHARANSINNHLLSTDHKDTYLYALVLT